MDILNVLLVGLALSMDAFAVTIANCSTYKNNLTPLKEWSMPLAFAVFQGIMPLIGYFLGSIFSGYLTSVIKYVTFGIFLFLSIKIVFDNVQEIIKTKKNNALPQNSTNGIKQGTAEETQKTAKFTFLILLVQAIATSIDALAVGVTFITYSIPSALAAFAIIAAITFAIITIALLFGKYLGKIFGKYATWFGAAILLGLSIKFLVEALV